MMQLRGRRSSHFTRVAMVFAHELKVPVELVPIYDITSTQPGTFGDNPALKLPILHTSQGAVFGTENICRTLVEHAKAPGRIVWPEQLISPLSRNAQEFAWHAMNAEVQLVFGTMVGKLPPDNVYFVKGRAGFEGALGWLERHHDEALAALPAQRALSLFEVTLFCVVEHIAFRQSLPLEPYPRLRQFAAKFATRPSAQATAYRFDVEPT